MSAWKDIDDVDSFSRYVSLNAEARSLSNANHGDNRTDANNDPQHCQACPQLTTSQGTKRPKECDKHIGAHRIASHAGLAVPSNLEPPPVGQCSHGFFARTVIIMAANNDIAWNLLVPQGFDRIQVSRFVGGIETEEQPDGKREEERCQDGFWRDDRGPTGDNRRHPGPHDA